MSLVLIDSLASQAGEQCDTDTCYLNNQPKLDNLTLQPAFHVSVSRRPLWCHSLVCSLWLLYENFQRFSRRANAARLVRPVLCSGLRGARGARTMPPHVHPGWKVRTLRTECSGLLEKTCLLCSACLSLGQGLWRGGGAEDKNMEEQKDQC